MSFGFSVGDFLAVGKLVTDIVSSLKDVGGSQNQYRDLICELECLRLALDHVKSLAQTRSSQHADAIKYTALSCRRPLEDFLSRINKYDDSLGARPQSTALKAVFDKVKFPLGHGTTSIGFRPISVFISER